MADVQVAIVGAGPYGLATAAYLGKAGVDTYSFGKPMESWRRNMPDGMWLRSAPRSSHIADPDRSLGLDAWSAETGGSDSYPIKVEDFISYADWFQDKVAPTLDTRRVMGIDTTRGGFALSLEDGTGLTASRVIVAAGITNFAVTPAQFKGLNGDLVSHSFQHDTLDRFAGKKVLVVGGGQSALETAALLTEVGAEPRLVARAGNLVWLRPFAFLNKGVRARISEAIRPPTDLGGRITGWLAAAPGTFRYLPRRAQATVGERCTTPAGAPWLRPRLDGVPMDVGYNVTRVEKGSGSLTVTYDDSAEHLVDHAILCTGYRVDLSRYEFLTPALLARIESSNGYPRLGRGLESSIEGLHFAGAPAAASFGPIMRFVVGTWYAGPAVARSVAGVKLRPAHLSYRRRWPRSASE